MSGASGPLTLGTGGHIDHGKTALVRALTGRDTDRLPAERERGISIELGYARLDLPSGRRLSVVDVPGHERFVRTMVAGATGVDLFLLTVAADDGVMPQTREHWTVLQALGVERGVVAITKADVADPAPAAEEARALTGAGLRAVACSARTGAGLDELRAALDAAAAQAPSRAQRAGPAVLHVDRSFSVRGAGTVVTGTLWSGELGSGETVDLLPSGRRARIRGLQVHDRAVERAAAGQRVAVNLTGVDRDAVARGDVLATPGAGIAAAWIIDAALDLRVVPPGGRVHVHHGTRESPARIVALGEDLWQIRARAPLLARAGDRLVIRASSPPDTLGGGIVVEPGARRHGAGADVVARLRRARAGEPVAEPGPEPDAEPVAAGPPPLTTAALALEQRLREAGHEPPSEAELGDLAVELPALRAAGRAVRVGRSMYAHPEALDAVRERAVAIIDAEGGLTLARLRDELGTSRRYAQALLEHLDAARVTLRLPDDRRVLRRSARG
ncbi:selenocysteine-specific translation elongation factor [Capillimicrobium parvum]|uniref:Selenocysteine-specific elongation factor n=1 Tax=Capillimicrobium parvum TaxID=2884022 RepID=A0A9E6Y3N1_9ACTN|nr:selenocysteine-specific translation elongation factor [Capillimicrobium parvum]UGS38858.1 Elongation factor Tu [Capillimicrobium parvum]